MPIIRSCCRKRPEGYEARSPQLGPSRPRMGLTKRESLLAFFTILMSVTGCRMDVDVDPGGRLEIISADSIVTACTGKSFPNRHPKGKPFEAETGCYRVRPGARVEVKASAREGYSFSGPEIPVFCGFPLTACGCDVASQCNSLKICFRGAFVFSTPSSSAMGDYQTCL